MSFQARFFVSATLLLEWTLPVSKATMDSEGREIVRLKFRWPSHFPELCPPDDAVPAAGVVFRTVSGSPPTPWDFLPHIEVNPEGRYATETNKAHRVSPRFMASGISTFRVYADAIKNTSSMRDACPR